MIGGLWSGSSIHWCELSHGKDIQSVTNLHKLSTRRFILEQLNVENQTIHLENGLLTFAKGFRKTVIIGVSPVIDLYANAEVVVVFVTDEQIWVN